MTAPSNSEPTDPADPADPTAGSVARPPGPGIGIGLPSAEPIEPAVPNGQASAPARPGSGPSHVDQLRFDGELVGRWFRRVLTPGDRAMPAWTIVPTPEERAALDFGGRQVAAAVRATERRASAKLHAQTFDNEPWSKDPTRESLAQESQRQESPPEESLRETLPTQASATEASATEASATEASATEASATGAFPAAALPTEVPARMVRAYLSAFAAAVASARHALALDDQPTTTVNRDSSTSGEEGALELVTGLNAAAAALHGEIAQIAEIAEIAQSGRQLGAPAGRPVEHWSPTDPSAAESARLAGFAAAELVVNGAALHEIVAAAAAAAAGGWRVGVPRHHVERSEYRARALVAALLAALEIETRGQASAGEPASCGAGPGESSGRRFDAEITFTMSLDRAEIHSLLDDLDAVSMEVAVWPGQGWPLFHVHTDQPADVIAQVYARGTPFDLEISALD